MTQQQKICSSFEKLTAHCSETGFGSAFLIFRPTIIVAEHEAKDAKAVFIDKIEKGIVAIGGEQAAITLISSIKDDSVMADAMFVPLPTQAPCARKRAIEFFHFFPVGITLYAINGDKPSGMQLSHSTQLAIGMERETFEVAQLFALLFDMPSAGKKRGIALLQLFCLLMRFRIGIFRFIVAGHEDDGKEQ